jgi:hypothetical protein
MAIYPPGPLKFVWQYLSSTLSNFKVKLLGYRTYRALLTQSGLSVAPTAIVLENTIDPTLTWTVGGSGEYYINCQSPAFKDPSKVAVSIGLSAASGGIGSAYGFFANYEISSPTDLGLYTTDPTIFPIDSVLANTEFTIKIYL